MIAFTDSTRYDFKVLEYILKYGFSDQYKEFKEIIDNEFSNKKKIKSKVKRVIQINKEVMWCLDVRTKHEKNLFVEYYRIQEVRDRIYEYGIFILNRKDIIKSFYEAFRNFIKYKDINLLELKLNEFKKFKDEFEEFLCHLI